MKEFEPEVVFAAQEKPGAVSQRARAGKLRKLGPGLYTRDLKGNPADIVRRNIWKVVAGYCPGALLVDRTALELRPAEDGSVFVVGGRPRKVDIPGLKLRVREGVGPLPADFPLQDGVSCASLGRAYIENLATSRSRETVARTVGRKGVEGHLERVLRNHGEQRFNMIRDQVRAVGAELGMESEAAEVSRIMGTLLGTRSERLTNSAAQARARGEPYDPERVALLATLSERLRETAPLKDAVDTADDLAFRNRAFFEAYFSNFIEGTEFELSEAVDVVFKGVIPARRPEDGHDILGTYELANDKAELARKIAGVDDFLAVLRERHARIMRGRPEMRPGVFKEKVNRAGATTFVHPENVRGTLREGLWLLERLEDPLQRAMFVMFLVSEVHPFDDGNGRISRIMMNAELVRAGAAPLIIPTVYRANYLAALKGLTRHGQPDAYIRMIAFAHQFTQRVPWEDFDVAVKVLESVHAFLDADEAERSGKLLRLPTADDLVLAAGVVAAE